MRSRAPLSVVGLMVLVLSGCAGTAVDMSALESPMNPPPSALITPDDIDSVQEGVAYARALTGSTPELAEEIRGTVEALDDLVAEADLPSEVTNDIGVRLRSLILEVQLDPADAEDYLDDLRAVADDLSEEL